MRLTAAQMYMLTRLKVGAAYEELATWDQRPLRGLFLRGLFYFDRDFRGWLTAEGSDLLHYTRAPKLRQNHTDPLFSRSGTIRIHRRVA